MVREDILSRVQKLLNMTVANGCTEAEAAKAAGLAQQLILKHEIAMVELEAAGAEPEAPAPVGHTTLDQMPSSMRQVWRGYLAHVLAVHNGCSTLWMTGGKPRLVIAGTEADVAKVRMLYAFCVEQTEHMAKQYSGAGRTWLNVWRHGVADGIAYSLREAREKVRAEQAAANAAACSALVIVDRALARIDDRTRLSRVYFEQKYKIKKSGGNPAANKDADARGQGFNDGRQINVSGVGKALK